MLDLLRRRCVANACAVKESDLKTSVANKLKTEENKGDVVMQE
jgi:hypothetical protein